MCSREKDVPENSYSIILAGEKLNLNPTNLLRATFFNRKLLMSVPESYWNEKTQKVKIYIYFLAENIFNLEKKKLNYYWFRSLIKELLLDKNWLDGQSPIMFIIIVKCIWGFTTFLNLNTYKIVNHSKMFGTT